MLRKSGARTRRTRAYAADAAAASINLTDKYKGYTSEGVKAAVQAIYDELGTSPTR